MNEHIEQERTKLFEVIKLALHSGVEGFETDNAFGIFRSTGGKSLGIVGKNYTPTQNTLLFEGFLECLNEVPKADLNTLKVLELNEGRKIKISCGLGMYGFTNILGKEDSMEMHLNLQTSYDGTGKTSLFLSTYRLICENGLKAHTTEINLSFKNTKGNIAKANIMCQDVVRVIGEQESYLERLKQLSKRTITQQEQDDFIFKVTGVDPRKEQKANGKKMLDEINKSVAIEMNNAGATAFTLMNIISHYTNHSNKKRNVNDFIYSGAGLALNQKAQVEAFALLN